MNKNPFSIYDFMGYLFPGIVCSVFLYLLFHFNGNLSKLTDVMLVKDAFLTSNINFDLDKSIMFIVFSYILGHIVSYTSSLTIEQFAIKVFNYPSSYLLQNTPKTYRKMCHDFFLTQAQSSSNTMRWIKIILRFVLKIFICFIISPVSFTVFTFGYLFDINGWIVRKLDDYLIDTIQTKQYQLANRLQISHPDVNDNECDYHRIIQHYVYLNIPNSQRKTDNYIALYGFLRCMSLIFSLAFGVVFVYAVFSIDFKADIDWVLCGLLGSLYFISYLSFLGFMKFYRRFTLENYMTLLSGMIDTNGMGNI